MKEREAVQKWPCAIQKRQRAGIGLTFGGLFKEQAHRILSAALVVATCSVISYFYMASYGRVAEAYREETQSTITNLKKSFLKNTVDNLILEIESDRKAESARLKRLIDLRYGLLAYRSYQDDADFVEYCMAAFDMDRSLGGDPYSPDILLWSKSSSQVVYDPSNRLSGPDMAAALEKVKASMAYYRIVEHGDMACLIGFRQECVDAAVKDALAEKIKALTFDNDSYIWVNEIINYAGGKDYAIRRIHPNLPETEGMYLSTDMKDIKGNLPYLVELEGIKERGELFFQYYFKELHSGNISEKISYAKLYKDYNWIIAMGAPINQIEQYVEQANDKGAQTASSIALKLLTILIVAVIFLLTLFMLLERLRATKTQKLLEQEIDMDALTCALSRKRGIKDLIEAFTAFRAGGASPMIMMFDVDNFKHVNDSFGHDTGDRLLREIVEAVKETIRNTDMLIRWGGDEFVGIFNGVKKEKAMHFSKKIRDAIAALSVDATEETIRPTVSIGVSYFRKGDESYSPALKRADEAMYRSKAEGRNHVNIG